MEGHTPSHEDSKQPEETMSIEQQLASLQLDRQYNLLSPTEKELLKEVDLRVESEGKTKITGTIKKHSIEIEITGNYDYSAKIDGEPIEPAEAQELYHKFRNIVEYQTDSSRATAEPKAKKIGENPTAAGTRLAKEILGY